MSSPHSRRAFPRVRAAILALAIPLLPPNAGAQQTPAVLDTVRVSGRTGIESAAPARTVEVIGRTEIASSPARSVADLLALRLGLDVLERSPAQADLALRGKSTEQVLILVDGVRVSDRQTGHFALDLAVPLAAVERIEVLRGASSALYGSDAVGGVINIVTRPDGGDASAQLRGGSFGTATAAVSLAETVGRVHISASGDWERSDGHRDGTDFDVRQARARVAHQVVGGSFALDAGVAVRAFGAADFYGPYPSFERTGTTTTSLRWTSDASAAWGVDAVVHSRIHSDRYVLYRDDPSVYENLHRTRQSGAELTVRRALGQGLGIAFGAEGANDRLTSERLGDRDEQRGALFGELAYSHSTGASVQAGLRADRATGRATFVSPSVAVAIPVRRDLSLRASVSRGLRAPTWTDRYYTDPANVGNPDLEPETFWTGELGARLSLADGVSMDLAAWTREARDLIDWGKPLGAGDVEPWRTMNVKSASFHGLETVVRLNDVLGADWRVRGGLTRVNAQEVDGFESKYALRPLERFASIGGTFGLPLGFAADVDVTHARRVSDDRGSHTRADLRVSRAWRDITFTLDARNLGHVRYVDVSGLPVAGRAVYAGVTWRR